MADAMITLIEWLREQLDTDERLARDLYGACWHIDICRESGHNFFDALDVDQLLAEVQSKRAILDFYEKTVKGRKEHRDDIGLAGALLALHGVVKHLAKPYRVSRPGFREEWLDG